MSTRKLTPNQTNALRGCDENEWRTHSEVKKAAGVNKFKNLRTALTALEKKGLIETRPTLKGYDYRLK